MNVKAIVVVGYCILEVSLNGLVVQKKKGKRTARKI